MSDEEESDRFDFLEEDDEIEVPDSEVIEKLRNTLTYDMAAKAYRCRYGEDIADENYEWFMDELINEHYDMGLNEWDDDYLYYD